MWDPLVQRDAETGEIQPHLAQSWKAVDPVTWEFKLAPGVKFHNGNPLTAEAVRFTVMDRILDPDQKSPQAGNYKWIKDVEVIDDTTFRIISHSPYPLVLERLNILFIYDPIETRGKGDAWVAENPTGSGPYKLVSWDRGRQLVMTANPDYWIEGIPKVKNIVYKIIPENSTRVAELLAGSIDVAGDMEADQYEVISKARGIRALNVPILRINFWQFDSMGRAGKSPLMDKRVRQAVCMAIDRKAIVEHIMQGLAGHLDSPMNPLQFGYDPTIKETCGYNPEKAKALLEEAGYGDGITLDLWQYYGYQNYPNQAAMGFLEEVGIKVNLKDFRGNVSQVIKLRNAGKVTDIGNFVWGSYNIFDSDAILPAWFLRDSPMCYTDDPELHEWLTAARQSIDPEERKQLYSRAQKKIMEEVYWMPFYVVHQIYGVKENLNIVLGADEVPRLQHAFWE